MEEEAEAFKRRQIDKAYKGPDNSGSGDEKSSFIRITPDVLAECDQ